jgi:hypothetical protein
VRPRPSKRQRKGPEIEDRAFATAIAKLGTQGKNLFQRSKKNIGTVASDLPNKYFLLLVKRIRTTVGHASSFNSSFNRPLFFFSHQPFFLFVQY